MIKNFNEFNLNEKLEKDKLHDPRGKKVKVGRYLIHKSMPENREEILKNGIIPKVGERYSIDNGKNTYNRMGAIFATNSENKKDWFGEDWDEDIWRIDTKLIPNVEWYKDKMFSFNRSGFPFPFLYKHVVTLQNIPTNAIELIHKGTGKCLIPL